MILILILIIALALIIVGGNNKFILDEVINTEKSCFYGNFCENSYDINETIYVPDYDESAKEKLMKNGFLNFHRNLLVNFIFSDCSFGLGIITYNFLKNMDRKKIVVLFTQNDLIPSILDYLGFKYKFFTIKESKFNHIKHFPSDQELSDKGCILLNFNLILPRITYSSKFEAAGIINRKYATFLQKKLKPSFSLHLMYGTVLNDIKEECPVGEILILPFAYPGRNPFFVIKGKDETDLIDISDISVRVKIFDICQRNINHNIRIYKERDTEKYRNYDQDYFYKLSEKIRIDLFTDLKTFNCSEESIYYKHEESDYYTFFYDENNFNFLNLPKISLVDNTVLACDNISVNDIKSCFDKINFNVVWCDDENIIELLHEAYPNIFIKTFSENIRDRNYVIKYSIKDIDPNKIIKKFKSRVFDKYTEHVLFRKYLIRDTDLIWFD